MSNTLNNLSSANSYALKLQVYEITMLFPVYETIQNQLLIFNYSIFMS